MNIELKKLNIDIDSKWNDYPYDTLYLWNGDTVFKITEGTGDNLLWEDEQEGYKDYWLTESRSKTHWDDGGQWLEMELIYNIDYTIQGVLNRMMECDLWEDDWTILDYNSGEELFDYLSDLQMKGE